MVIDNHNLFCQTCFHCLTICVSIFVSQMKHMEPYPSPAVKATSCCWCLKPHTPEVVSCSIWMWGSEESTSWACILSHCSYYCSSTPTVLCFPLCSMNTFCFFFPVDEQLQLILFSPSHTISCFICETSKTWFSILFVVLCCSTS